MKRILAAALLVLSLAEIASAAGLTFSWVAGYPIIKGNKMEAVVDVTFDSSYPTGGESLTAAMLGFTSLDFVSCSFDTVKTYRVVSHYDLTNSKLMAFFVSHGDTAVGYRQPKATTNLALCTVRLSVTGN